MEEVVKRYWRRRKYKRIEQHGSSRGKRAKVERLGRNRRRKWTFRVKFTPRVRSLSRLIISPKKLLILLRDKYVKMMLTLAQSTSAFRGGEDHNKLVMGLGNRPLKEYDNTMVLQFYKSLMAQDKLINSGEIVQREH
ncbi:hypothetical protein MRB53_010613 [Persea americana]|uniref:Uncharacterized protein n=1 Tax=Persea americana TaxID=3435 RepID=A0ACC2LSK0_PERAE|nr:hypothetical protein MRB53_010613 [Persea americana]